MRRVEGRGEKISLPFTIRDVLQSAFAFLFDLETSMNQMFEQMAEEALQKCDMAPLNPRYRLDFVLLSCFGDTEMSYLSEILCEYIQPEEE